LANKHKKTEKNSLKIELLELKKISEEAKNLEKTRNSQKAGIGPYESNFENTKELNESAILEESSIEIKEIHNMCGRKKSDEKKSEFNDKIDGLIMKIKYFLLGQI